MLDRVTPRPQMRDELINITRMLLGLPPAVRGDLPAPTEGGDLPHALTSDGKAELPKK
jgi:acetyl-CoA carboxylase carboxyl transferase subunit beta